MLAQKESILWRPIKKPSITNVQSAEIATETEKLRLQAKQTKRALLIESRQIALYGSPEEKASQKKAVRDIGELQQVQARMQKREERKHEIYVTKEALNDLQSISLIEQQRESRKREQLRTFQEENRRAIITKSAEKLRNKVKEDSRDRRMIEERLRSHTPNVL